MDHSFTPSSDYESAVQWIYDRINYERIRPTSASGHFRLDRMEQLLELVDAPHRKMPAIHIAGTKGKGSTAAMLAAILTASNFRTGLFTSPHIHRFEERMRVDGQMPTSHELIGLVDELRSRLDNAPSDLLPDGPTYFEVATLLSWMHFDRQQADVVVLETGLGGRLDCTNVCQPLITMITAIGLDHTHILGTTLDKIAWEKAGIIKQGVPLISWPVAEEAQVVIAQRAADLKCHHICGPRDLEIISREQHETKQRVHIRTTRGTLSVTVPLLGEHQARNAAMAVCAGEMLAETYPSITADTICCGLMRTDWPMRFQQIPGSPPVILDVAHNPDSVQAFVKTLQETVCHCDGKRVVIFASSTDKDAAGMLQVLSRCFDAVVLTQFTSNPRSTPVAELQTLIPEMQLTHQAASPAEALRAARRLAGSDGLVGVTGSIFLTAEIGAIIDT